MTTEAQQVMQALQDEIRKLREENRMLRESLVYMRSERDRFQNKWLNSADNWRPGTYQNGA